MDSTILNIFLKYNEIPINYLIFFVLNKRTFLTIYYISI